MPLGESMRSVLKSNKSIMLDKSKRFKKTLGGYDKNRKMEFDLPKATPKQLREIRQRIKKDNQILWVKILGVSVIIISLVWMLFAS